MVGAVVVRGEALAHHPMVGPVVGPGTDVAGAQAEAGGRHGLLHRGPIEQHRAVAGEAAVQFVSGALQWNLVSHHHQVVLVVVVVSLHVAPWKIIAILL